MKRNYDAVAGIYDILVKIFIGNSLKKAQVYFLKDIPYNANIFIAGGGTGWILEEISAIHKSGLYIDYVDSSGKMIKLAKKRYKGNNQVNFIQQSLLDFSTSLNYDVIITPFFLDNFNEKSLDNVFAILHSKLTPGGLWIHTDFQIINKSPWQKMMLFVMYSFFQICCKIEAKRLPDLPAVFIRYKYHVLKSHTFLKDFIITTVYKNFEVI